MTKELTKPDEQHKRPNKLPIYERELLELIIELYERADFLTLPELEELYASVCEHGTDHEDGKKADAVIEGIIKSVLEGEIERRTAEAQGR